MCTCLYPRILISLCLFLCFVYPCILISLWILACSHSCIFRFICPTCILASSHPQVCVCLLVSLHLCILISSDSCVLPCILTSSHPQGHVCSLVFLHPHILVSSGLCVLASYAHILKSMSSRYK